MGIFQATSHQALVTVRKTFLKILISVHPDQLALIFTGQFSEKKVLKILVSIPLHLIAL